MSTDFINRFINNQINCKFLFKIYIQKKLSTNLNEKSISDKINCKFLLKIYI